MRKWLFGAMLVALLPLGTISCAFQHVQSVDRQMLARGYRFRITEYEALWDRDSHRFQTLRLVYYAPSWHVRSAQYTDEAAVQEYQHHLYYQWIGFTDGVQYVSDGSTEDVAKFEEPATAGAKFSVIDLKTGEELYK